MGKGRDVANKKAALCGHNHQDDEDEPETDPHSASEILKVVSLTELSEKHRPVSYTIRYNTPEIRKLKCSVLLYIQYIQYITPFNYLIEGFFKH